MRGDDLLLAHLAALPELDDSTDDDRPSARERLEDELGADLAAQLVRSLAAPDA